MVDVYNEGQTFDYHCRLVVDEQDIYIAKEPPRLYLLDVDTFYHVQIVGYEKDIFQELDNFDLKDMYNVNSLGKIKRSYYTILDYSRNVLGHPDGSPMNEDKVLINIDNNSRAQGNNSFIAQYWQPTLSLYWLVTEVIKKTGVNVTVWTDATTRLRKVHVLLNSVWCYEGGLGDDGEPLGNDTPYEQYISIAYNCNFKNAREILDVAVKLLGLIMMPYVNDNGEFCMEILSYADLNSKENRARSLDWSRKLLRSTPKINLTRAPLAQVNEVQFAKEETDEFFNTRVVHTYLSPNTVEFEVKNKSIKGAETVAQFSFPNPMAVKERSIFGGWLNIGCAVYRYRYVEEMDDVEFVNNQLPCLVCRNDQTTTIAIGNHYIAYTASNFTNGILTFYNELKETCSAQNFRLIEVQMLLDAQDIFKFRQSKIIYIRYFGAYFYVNKISDWIFNKPTKVELIKLPNIPA